MNLQGETYMQELAEGAEPQDLLESADKEVASLRAEVVRLTLREGELEILRRLVTVCRIKLKGGIRPHYSLIAYGPDKMHQIGGIIREYDAALEARTP